MNKVVMEYYFRSQKTDVNGIPLWSWRLRMFEACQEVGLFE